MPLHVKEGLPRSVQLIGAVLFGAFLLVGALLSNASGSTGWVIGFGLVGALVMAVVQLAVMRMRRGHLERS